MEWEVTGGEEMGAEKTGWDAIARDGGWAGSIGRASREGRTASAPSSTALATSEHSARVGRGFLIIDSSICVATTTGLPALLRTTASSVTTASPSRHRRGRPHHRVKPACAITPRPTHHRTRNRPLTVPMRPTPPAYATRSTAAMRVAQPRHTPPPQAPPRGLVARGGAQRWGGGRCTGTWRS